MIRKTFFLHATLLTRAVSVPKHSNCDYSQIEIRDECPTLSFIDWETYGEELYKAKSLVFGGAREASISRMYELLLSITENSFYTGFECPLAACSSFFSLAEKLANMGRFRRAQALLIMGFIFVRDKGFYDCSPWPVHGWDMLLASRYVNEKVTYIDKASVIGGVPKRISIFEPLDIAIVSVCAYGDDQPIKSLSRENHKLYADLHGYKLYQIESRYDLAAKWGMKIEDRNMFFSKILAVRNIISNHKWVMWMDCDAFFMDPERSIDSVIYMYSHNRTAPLVNTSGGEISLISREIMETLSKPIEVELLISVDSTGINNGVWIMRNSDWSIDFLHRWWNSTILQGMGANHNCSDQSTMQHELLYRNMMADLNTEFGEAWDLLGAPIWPREVRVVPQEHMQSFHKETAEAVVSREWIEGDFVKHHPGCHYYLEPCQRRFHDAHMSFLHKVKDLVYGDWIHCGILPL